MKIATNAQLLAVAAKYDAIGHNGTCLYAVRDGVTTRFAATCYIDSMSNLAREGKLVYNGDYTYSIAR